MKERQNGPMMSSRASSLLRKASGGFEPSLADKTKTRAAIARRVGVGVAAGAAVAAGAKSAAAAPSIAPAALVPAAVVVPSATAPVAVGFAGAGFATKFIAAVAIVGTVSAGAVTMHHAASTRAPNWPVASVKQTAASEQKAQFSAVLPTTLLAPPSPQPIADLAQIPANPDVSAKSAKSIPTTPTPTSNAIPTATKPMATTATKPVMPQVGAETDLIQGAQQAMRVGDANRALALLNEHAQRFPNGGLSEERDAARVLALCAAGRQEDAATAGAAFLSAYPNSTSAPRVRASCANDSAQ